MFSQGFKHIALPTADKHQRKTSRVWGSWTGNTSSFLQIFLPWQSERTPSNYNDDIFISQLELHIALQTKAGMKANRSVDYPQAQQSFRGFYLKAGRISVTSTLRCSGTRRPSPPCLEPQSVHPHQLLSLEHEHTTRSLTRGLCLVSLKFLAF